MKRQVVGIAGKKGSGKDTVADHLVEHLGFVKLSFAEALYEEVSKSFNVSTRLLQRRETKELGMLPLSRSDNPEFKKLMVSLGFKENATDREHLLSPRAILQYWGTEYRRANFGDDYWINKLNEKIGKLDLTASIVVSDVRLKNELEYIKTLNGNTYLVDRPLASRTIDQHVSEQINFEADGVIDNSGTQEELYFLLNQVFGIYAPFFND